MAYQNAINAGVTGIITASSTGVMTGTTVTQYYSLVGGASNAITSVAPSATSGVPLISQGSSSNPAFGTVVPAGGGTGLSTTTAYGLIAAGTTSTGNFQNINSVASGQVLTSAGTSALPSWSATPTLTSVTLGTGTAFSTYQQGTFTPSLQLGGAAVGMTYSYQVGQYTQIGNVVYINISFALTALGSSTGNATITGLPVTSNSTANNNQFLNAYYGNVSFGGSTFVSAAEIVPSSTSIVVFGVSGSTGAINQFTNANLQNTSVVRINGFYFT